MNDFQPTILIKLINFYKPENISSLKEAFIKSNICEEDQPYFIKEEIGILEFYNSQDKSFHEIKFEHELDTLLWTLTNELKAEIEQSHIYLTKKSRNSYWNRILDSFEIHLNQNPDIYQTFSVLHKPQEEIKKFLLEQFNYKKIIDKISSSYFELKSGITLLQENLIKNRKIKVINALDVRLTLQ